MARVALFANGWVGLQVAQFLRDSGDQIVRLYIHNPDLQNLTDEIISAVALEPEAICLAKDSHTTIELEKLRTLKPEFIITVYWAHLLKPELFTIASRGTINFHPALLPINRGWYPHVHSLIDGTPFGVTLHQIDADADTGPIWIQKEFFPDPTHTAADIYDHLQKEIAQLFRDNWNSIKSGALIASNQDHSKAVYHKKREIERLDRCDLDNMSARELLNRLKARTFGSRGFAFFETEKGEKIYMHLRLSRESRF